MKRLGILLTLLLLLPLGVSAAVMSTNTAVTLHPGDSVTISTVGDGVLQYSNQSNTGAVITFIASTPQPTPSGSSSGIWISRAEVQALPMNGAAWDTVKSRALGNWGTANLKDLNSQHDVYTLGGALYYARTGDAAMRTKVANAIMSSIGTEDGGRALEPSRNILSYVIAADLIDLQAYDSNKNTTFKNWLTSVRNEVLDGKSIIQTHNQRPNNWGTHAGATRVAIARYIGDTTDLAAAANVFKGWLGDRNAYNGFSFGDLAWQYDKTKPVAINPKGATRDGHNIDGVLPDDQRRGCGFTWPPCKEGYTWEALQGATVQAQLLSRAGYDVWNWSDKAMLRAVTWLYTVNSFKPEGDDLFIPWVINKAYGTSFATNSPVSIGKNMAYTDFTHK